MSFDFSNRRLVLAGTCYGEARAQGRSAMENVAQVVLNRVKYNWFAGAGGITGACLAHLQFSCWNLNDPNRAEIIAAAASMHPPTMWAIALDVADAAIAGRNPNRVCEADSYYAVRSPRPYWAKPPGRRVYGDGWHEFWILRPDRGAHVEPPETPSDLNRAELAALQGASS